MATDSFTLRAKHTLNLVAPIVLMFSLVGVTSAWAQSKELAGAKDHTLVSRYAGSTIIGYDQRQFDELVFPLGPIVRPKSNEMRMLAPKSQRVEGRMTRIVYVAPENRSTLEVLRNYEQALTKAGFKTLYTCSLTQCGLDDGWLAKFYLYIKERKLTNTRLAEDAFSFPTNQRYLVAKLTRPEGDVYTSIYVATETFDHYKEVHNRSLTLLEVIETTPMEGGLVTVDAKAMAKDISATGHVALYGIYFDTNSADVKAESAPALQEIATLLEQDPKLNVFIVGHTDNVGGYDFNLTLSQRRADAVVKSLTSGHAIDVKRLRAVGAGLMAPVAVNDTDEGRAKNRRVELVKQ